MTHACTDRTGRAGFPRYGTHTHQRTDEHIRTVRSIPRADLNNQQYETDVFISLSINLIEKKAVFKDSFFSISIHFFFKLKLRKSLPTFQAFPQSPPLVD